MKIILIITIIIITLSPLVHSTESTGRLTLDIETAVDLALQNNLGIKIENCNVREKQWALASAWNTFLPTVSMNATLQTINPDIVENARDDAKKSPAYQMADKATQEEILDAIPRGGVQAAFNLSLTLNAAMIFEIIDTVKDWQSETISLERARRQLIKHTKGYYYNIIVINENIAILDFNLDSAAKRYALMQEKYANNLISELELLNAELTYENLKPKRVKLENQYREAVSFFKSLTGIKQDVELALTGTIEILDETLFEPDAVYHGCLNDNLSLRYAQSVLGKMINTRNYYIGLLTPSISIGVLLDPAFTGPDPFGKDNNWFGDVSNEWRENGGNISFSLSVPLSAFAPFSTEQMKITKSQIAIKKQRLHIENEKQTITLEVEKILGRIDEFYSSLTVLQMNIALAEKVYTLTEHLYTQGLKTHLELEEAEKDINEAKLNLLQAKYDYIINVINLEYLWGGNSGRLFSFSAVKQKNPADKGTGEHE